MKLSPIHIGLFVAESSGPASEKVPQQKSRKWLSAASGLRVSVTRDEVVVLVKLLSMSRKVLSTSIGLFVAVSNGPARLVVQQKYTNSPSANSGLFVNETSEPVPVLVKSPS